MGAENIQLQLTLHRADLKSARALYERLMWGALRRKVRSLFKWVKRICFLGSAAAAYMAYQSQNDMLALFAGGALVFLLMLMVIHWHSSRKRYSALKKNVPVEIGVDENGFSLRMNDKSVEHVWSEYDTILAGNEGIALIENKKLKQFWPRACIHSPQALVQILQCGGVWIKDIRKSFIQQSAEAEPNPTLQQEVLT